MDKPIQMPVIYKRRTTNQVSTLGGEYGLPNGSNTFLAKSIVKYSGGYLAAIATDDVIACGICPDASHTAGTISVPDALKGDKHWPFDLNGLQFLINIGHVKSSTDVAVGAANSAKQLSDVSVGTSYGVYVPTTGTYAGIPFLDPTDTTNLLFKVIDKPLNLDPLNPQTAATYNAQVLVEVISTCIQALG